MSLNPQFGAIVPSPIQTPSPSNYLVFDGAAGGMTSRNNIYQKFMNKK